MPPTPLVPLPTVSTTAPPRPAVAAPVPTMTPPLLPDDVVPELNASEPLAPDSPAFMLRMSTAPLDVAVPSPDDRLSSPPVCTVLRPL